MYQLRRIIPLIEFSVYGEYDIPPSIQAPQIQTYTFLDSSLPDPSKTPLKTQHISFAADGQSGAEPWVQFPHLENQLYPTSLLPQNSAHLFRHVQTGN